MEVKKSPQADLENKKSIFFELGLTVALVTVLFAFEWRISEKEPSNFITVSEIPTETELIPVTVMTQLPPPPPPAAPKAFELLEIVDEMAPLDSELEITDVDDQSENQEFNFTDITYGEEENNEIITFLPSEDMPAFPGNVQSWISKNIKYPALALENGVEGKVIVQFVVERDGSVSHVKVVRSADPSLDKEAIRVISSMPKWKPGKQRGIAVRVAYTMPIFFNLEK